MYLKISISLNFDLSKTFDSNSEKYCCSFLLSLFNGYFFLISYVKKCLFFILFHIIYTCIHIESVNLNISTKDKIKDIAVIFKHLKSNNKFELEVCITGRRACWTTWRWCSTTGSYRPSRRTRSPSAQISRRESIKKMTLLLSSYN